MVWAFFQIPFSLNQNEALPLVIDFQLWVTSIDPVYSHAILALIQIMPPAFNTKFTTLLFGEFKIPLQRLRSLLL